MSIFSKVTVAAVMAVSLTGTLCYLAVTGAVQGETFLAAVVGGAFAWAFGTSKGTSPESVPQPNELSNPGALNGED